MTGHPPQNSKKQPYIGERELGADIESSVHKLDESCDDHPERLEEKEKSDLLQLHKQCQLGNRTAAKQRTVLTDAASVMSLDLGGGAQSLEGNSDAESFATGMGLNE